MSSDIDGNVQGAQVVLPCAEIESTIRFFIERLGFRLDAIQPADDPRVAVLSGHGVCLRLERGASGAPGTIRLACRDPSAIAGGAAELTAPNGTRVQIVPAQTALDLPPLRPSFVLSRMRDAVFVEGRAGMRYRDLLPDRQGGRFIASHIQIAQGGPVPDYVHFHLVAFQMILYCTKGWVRVVYEDQGEPFVLRAGDCALQPRRIRHRVLECSAGVEVIEIGSPAEHETRVDHELTLPTPHLRPERDFAGQRFVRHEASGATWRPWGVEGFEARDLGILAATGGYAGACVVRCRGGAPTAPRSHDGELLLSFVLAGSATLECAGRALEAVVAGDAVCVPAGHDHALTGCSDAFEMLEVRVRSGYSLRDMARAK